jgi:hypothetical protein
MPAWRVVPLRPQLLDKRVRWSALEVERAPR